MRAALASLPDGASHGAVVLTAERLSQADLDRLQAFRPPPERWRSRLDAAVAGVLPYLGPHRTRWARERHAELSRDEAPTARDLSFAQDLLGLVDRAPLDPERGPEADELRLTVKSMREYGAVPLVVPHDDPRRRPTDLPAFTISEFKGLEADSVIVLDQGARPLTATELFVAASRARSHLVLVLRDDPFRRHNLVEVLGARLPPA